MTFSTRLKGLEAAVKRLEAAAGKGQRTGAFGPYPRRHIWPPPTRAGPRAGDFIEARCEFCRSKYPVSLAGIPEDERDAYRLHYTFTIEDNYRDPRAHALTLWLQYWPQPEEARAPQPPPARKNGKGSRGARALARLREDYDRLFARKHKKLVAKYGASLFPEQIQLVESMINERRGKRRSFGYLDRLHELKGRETGLAICAELEKIIWGQTRPQTASALESTVGEIEELIAKEREKTERRNVWAGEVQGLPR